MSKDPNEIVKQWIVAGGSHHLVQTSDGKYFMTQWIGGWFRYEKVDPAQAESLIADEKVRRQWND